MRWVFPDPNDREENTARDAVRGRIDAWWQAFAENAEAIDAAFRGGPDFELVEFMQGTLQTIDENLMWEYGPALRGDGHRLAISPESEYGLHPLTAEILARAPELKRFEFYHGRPAEGPNWAIRSVEARVGVDVGKGSIRVDVGENNRVDTLFFFPGVNDPETARNAAFVAAESLFGEQLLDRWVGVIDALERPEGEGWMPFLDAADALQRGIKTVRESLPDTPWSQWLDDTAWTTLQINTAEEEREPTGWSDLLVATTPHVGITQALVQGTLFHSGRYSRFDEKFCYLKLDESELEGDERFERRRPLEDQLDAALREAGLGCLGGGGSGVWFGYSLLALTDVPAAIPLIRELARRHDAPGNSWLCFADFDWCAEWVGIWDDTPPPP